MTDSNTIYVGDKKLGKYINAVEIRLEEFEEVFISARGNNIRKAVDALELLKRKHKVKPVNIETGTDELVNDDTGEEFKISTLDVLITQENEE